MPRRTIGNLSVQGSQGRRQWYGCYGHGRTRFFANARARLRQGRRGVLGGCNPPKALETNRKQCAGVQIYSTVRTQSTVQPEHEKKVGVPSARCRRASWSHAFPINQMGQHHVCLRQSPINAFIFKERFVSDVDLSSSRPSFVVLQWTFPRECDFTSGGGKSGRYLELPPLYQ